MDHATIQALTLPCPTCHIDVQNEAVEPAVSAKLAMTKRHFAQIVAIN